MKTWHKVVATLATLPLLMGAFSACPAEEGKPKPYQTAGGPVRLPDPEPDHRPAPPTLPQRVPSPIAGDPNPHDEHQWTAFVSWSPAALFVEIDPPKGVTLERSGGFWSSGPPQKAYTGNRLTLTANWTDLSLKNKRTPPGSLKCVIVVDGKVRAEDEDSPAHTGVICSLTL